MKAVSDARGLPAFLVLRHFRNERARGRLPAGSFAKSGAGSGTDGRRRMAGHHPCLRVPATLRELYRVSLLLPDEFRDQIADGVAVFGCKRDELQSESASVLVLPAPDHFPERFEGLRLDSE